MGLHLCLLFVFNVARPGLQVGWALVRTSRRGHGLWCARDPDELGVDAPAGDGLGAFGQVAGVAVVLL